MRVPAKVPSFIQKLYPKRTWTGPTNEKAVYLTFDDGPVPEVTPWVLEQLKHFEARATFFCIGKNVAKHPDIFLKILAEGHHIGNHTHTHCKSTITPTKDYIENVLQAQQLLENTAAVEEKFQKKMAKKMFRPPYGRLSRSKAQQLHKLGFSVIMWDVLSQDYDASLSETQCMANIINHVRAGSILIFHDSLKAKKNLTATLPKVLAHLKENGYTCKALG